MAREHAEVSDEVKTRWGYGGTKPHHQVIRLKHDGTRRVLPKALERELEPPVGAPLESVLCDGWAGDVAAQPLELPSIAPVHALFGVDVDPPMLGDGHGRIVLKAHRRESPPLTEIS